MLNRHRGAARLLNADASVAGRRGPTAAVMTTVALLAAAASLAVLGAAAVPDAAAQQDAACREGFESIMKNADGSMACVSPGTKAVLIERGWGSEPVPVAQDAAAGMGDGMDDAAGMGDAAAAGMGDGMDDAAGMGDAAAAGMGDGMTAMSDDAMMGGPSGAGVPDVPEIDLTDAESARLTGEEIRVAYDPYRLPIEFYAENAGIYDSAVSLGGVSGAYLGWIDAALPADFVPVDVAALGGEPGAPVRPNEAVRDGVADVVMAIEPTEEMRRYMSFTESHTALPIVMATTGDTTLEVDSLSDMDVGAVSGYGAARWLDSISVEYKEYATGIEAINALDAGDINVFVGLWAVAFNSGMMAAPQVDVTNAGPTGQSEMLSIGYASSDAELGSALDKALSSTSDEMRASIAAMASVDPAEIFGDPDAFAEAFGGDETVSSLAGAAGEIDEINRSGGETKAKLGALPETLAFKEKYPEHDDSRFDDFGSFEATLTLTAAGGDASLLINYSKEDGTAAFTYMCTDSDGIQQYHYSDSLDGDMVSIIAGPCTEPDFG